MSNPRIITRGGLTLDLGLVKCFKLNSHSDIGKTNVLVVEYKTTHVDYIFNPKTEEFELHKYNEIIEMEYPSHDIASANRQDWIDVWQDYIDKTTENG